MTCETCIAVTFSRSFRRVVATGSSSVKERAGRQKSELSASLSCSQTSSHICVGVCVCVCVHKCTCIYVCMHGCVYIQLFEHTLYVGFIYLCAYLSTLFEVHSMWWLFQGFALSCSTMTQ